ncbi:MAG: metallophosphoesterase [Polyangiaceae bacterium]|nr:metallophosphoesterase [Polyangiaceae bacterium]
MRLLRILHISDLHERARFPRMPRDRRDLVDVDAEERGRVLGERFTTELRSLAAGGIDLVFFTGDIADWARPEEYAAATTRLDKILATVSVPRGRFFAVPGNHDVQRRYEPNAWNKLRNYVDTGGDHGCLSKWLRAGAPPRGLEPGVRNRVLKRTAAFWNWMESFGRGELRPGGNKLLGYRKTLPSGTFERIDCPVHVIGLDSAWLCGRDAEKGQLLLTAHQVLAHVRDGEKALDGVRVALVHHPLDWLADQREVQPLLGDGGVDILLHGHQHDPQVWQADEPGAHLRIVAAGCLMEGKRGMNWPNGFQLVEIDMRGKSGAVHFRKWATPGSFWTIGSDIYPEGRDGTLRWPGTGATTAAPAAPPAAVSVPATAAPAVPGAGARALAPAAFTRLEFPDGSTTGGALVAVETEDVLEVPDFPLSSEPDLEFNSGWFELTAGPGQGKTTFGLQLAARALEQRIPVFFCDLKLTPPRRLEWPTADPALIILDNTHLVEHSYLSEFVSSRPDRITALSLCRTSKVGVLRPRDCGVVRLRGEDDRRAYFANLPDAVKEACDTNAFDLIVDSAVKQDWMVARWLQDDLIAEEARPALCAGSMDIPAYLGWRTKKRLQDEGLLDSPKFARIAVHTLLDLGLLPSEYDGAGSVGDGWVMTDPEGGLRLRHPNAAAYVLRAIGQSTAANLGRVFADALVHSKDDGPRYAEIRRHARYVYEDATDRSRIGVALPDGSAILAAMYDELLRTTEHSVPLDLVRVDRASDIRRKDRLEEADDALRTVSANGRDDRWRYEKAYIHFLRGGPDLDIGMSILQRDLAGELTDGSFMNRGLYAKFLVRKGSLHAARERTSKLLSASSAYFGGDAERWVLNLRYQDHEVAVGLLAHERMNEAALATAFSELTSAAGMAHPWPNRDGSNPQMLLACALQAAATADAARTLEYSSALCALTEGKAGYAEQMATRFALLGAAREATGDANGASAAYNTAAGQRQDLDNRAGIDWAQQRLDPAATPLPASDPFRALLRVLLPLHDDGQRSGGAGEPQYPAQQAASATGGLGQPTMATGAMSEPPATVPLTPDEQTTLNEAASLELDQGPSPSVIALFLAHPSDESGRLEAAIQALVAKGCLRLGGASEDRKLSLTPTGLMLSCRAQEVAAFADRWLRFVQKQIATLGLKFVRHTFADLEAASVTSWAEVQLARVVIDRFQLSVGGVWSERRELVSWALAPSDLLDFRRARGIRELYDRVEARRRGQHSAQLAFNAVAAPPPARPEPTPALALATNSIGAQEPPAERYPLPPYRLDEQPWFCQSASPPAEGRVADARRLRARTKVLIVVVTDVEREAVLRVVAPPQGQDLPFKVHIGQETYYLGRIGAHAVAILKTEPGAATKPGSSAYAVQTALDYWDPAAVIAVGIAFGHDRSKQGIGDVLVSEQITCYELLRVGEGDSIRRGSIPRAGHTLLNRFHNATGWSFALPTGRAAERRCGEVLSGEKLVDNAEFHRKLFEAFPNAIGGEMEAVGIAFAAHRRQTEWIVVKGICDWGVGKGEGDQPLAAAAAASLVAHVLKNPDALDGLPGSRSARTVRRTPRKQKAGRVAPPDLTVHGSDSPVTPLELEQHLASVRAVLGPVLRWARKVRRADGTHQTVTADPHSSDLALRDGEIFMLQGRSGRGKSTVLRLLMGLALVSEPQRIPIEVRPVAGLGPLEWVRRALEQHGVSVASEASVRALLMTTPTLIAFDDWHNLELEVRRQAEDFAAEASTLRVVIVIADAPSTLRASVVGVAGVQYLELEAYSDEERDSVLEAALRAAGHPFSSNLGTATRAMPPGFAELLREPVILDLYVRTIRVTHGGGIRPPSNGAELMRNLFSALVSSGTSRSASADELSTLCRALAGAATAPIALENVASTLERYRLGGSASESAQELCAAGVWSTRGGGLYDFAHEVWRTYFRMLALAAGGGLADEARVRAWLRDTSDEDLLAALPFAAGLIEDATLQDALLGALLQRNVRLYFRALATRADRGPSSPAVIGRAQRFLEEVSRGYFGFIEHVCPGLRLGMDPWYRGDGHEADRQERPTLFGALRGENVQYYLGFGPKSGPAVSIAGPFSVGQEAPPEGSPVRGYSVQVVNLPRSGVRSDSGWLVGSQRAMKELESCVRERLPAVGWVARERVQQCLAALAGCVDGLANWPDWTPRDVLKWLVSLAESENGQLGEVALDPWGHSTVRLAVLQEAAQLLVAGGLGDVTVAQLRLPGPDRRPADRGDDQGYSDERLTQRLKALYGAVASTYRAVCEQCFPTVARQHFAFAQWPARMHVEVTPGNFGFGIRTWWEVVEEWNQAPVVQIGGVAEAVDHVLSRAERTAADCSRWGRPFIGFGVSDRALRPLAYEWGTPVSDVVTEILLADVARLSKWLGAAH